MTKNKPFKIKLHHRYELRDWLKSQFPFLDKKSRWNFTDADVKSIQERAIEIYDACMKIKRVDLRAGSAYIKYYAQDWERIEDSYLNKDYRGMAVALETLIDAIEVE